MPAMRNFMSLAPCGSSKRAPPSEPTCAGAVPFSPRLPATPGASCSSASSRSSCPSGHSTCDTLPRTRSSASMASECSSRSRLGAGGADRMKRAFIKDFLVSNGFVTVQSSRERLGVLSYPIHEAARQGNAEMVRMLIEAGANPMREDSMGRTAEQLAEAANWLGRRDDVLATLREAMYGLAMFDVEEEEVGNLTAPVRSVADHQPPATLEPPALLLKGQ
mmetsp:Transcript_85674/g.167638  ORF Transcript_85674/g.167638 Transcript_85674/m.167638 type:complete len:220 (-) Transcript_85674:100-759(-)